MTAIEPIAGRLLLWGTAVAASAAVGLPEYRSPAPAGLFVLTGPAAGTAAYVLLSREGFPRLGLQGRQMPVLAARWLYLTSAAAFEEVLWRGLGLAGLSLLIGLPAALAVSSAGFAAWHRRALGGRSVVHLVTGAAFGGAFLLGGLVAAILAHTVYNLLVDVAVQSSRARQRGP